MILERQGFTRCVIDEAKSLRDPWLKGEICSIKWNLMAQWKIEASSEKPLSLAMESRDGAAVRALASHQRGLASIPAPRHMWVQIVVNFRLAPRVFLFSGFPPSEKANTSNSNSTRMEEDWCGFRSKYCNLVYLVLFWSNCGDWKFLSCSTANLNDR